MLLSGLGLQHNLGWESEVRKLWPGGQLVREEGRDGGLTLGGRGPHSEAQLAVPGSTLAVEKVARDTELHFLEILEKLELKS